MSDQQELQELLTRIDEITPLRKPDVLAEPSQSQVASEHSQWEVGANGTFFPTGRTQHRLPTGAYTIGVTENGFYFEQKKILSDTLVDLDNSNSLQVIEGIKLFWKRREQFAARGVLYKRGILMWGPPGSGKTATLTLLMQELLKLGGIVILVQHPRLVIGALKSLRRIEPERPLIVVLEDVEEIIRTFGEHEILALLDGEHQTDNVVNIATTNYPELLGARIVNRPSRFDEVVKIGMPSARMREQYLVHVLGNADVSCDELQRWVADTEGMSIAHLKELVIAVTCLDQKYDTVIARLRTMKVMPKSTGYNEHPVGFTGQTAAAENRKSLAPPTR
jgi:hypothetical protein